MGALDSLKIVLNSFTTAVIFPVITVYFLARFFIYYRKITQPLVGTLEWITETVEKPRLAFPLRRHPMGKKDIAPLAIIIAVFAFLALFQLGDTSAPQSFFHFPDTQSRIVIELDSPQAIGSLMYYTGLGTGSYKLEFSTDGFTWQEQKIPDNQNTGESPSPVMDQPYSQLFKWRYANFSGVNQAVRYIGLTATRDQMELGEVALYDSAGALITGSRVSCPDAPELFDEQQLIPAWPTYMNSMYFDEIYHGRTAYEFLNGVYPYETTHPPLGKEIIALSIYILGMTPFGWRFAGAIFGVAMLVFLYIFIKNLFGKTAVAVCGTLLLGFDFMHFVQTRIATIDTYGVFFILLAYYFMYRLMTADSHAPFRKSLVPLALSGLFFGIGSASKWIVIYAALGLVALYIIRLVLLARLYKEERQSGYGAYLVKTLLFSALFFILIPVVIYCLSYIPYGLARNMTVSGGMLWNRDYYKIIWDNQVSMLAYHSKLTEGHPYASRWYQWIVDARPILYVNRSDGTMRSSFAAFGNPVVWWGGFIAMIAMAFRVIKHRDVKALFIIIGYLSQLLPWFAITRVVFIYHYFPSTLFLVLALAHIFDTILERSRGRYKRAVYGYTVAAGVLFAMFYPALTGVLAPQWYFKYFLRWIPGAWPF